MRMICFMCMIGSPGPSLRRSYVSDLQAQFVATLRTALGEAGATVHATQRDRAAGPDVRSKVGRRTFAFVVTACRVARRDELLGSLARAALVASDHAKSIHAVPVAIVGAPFLSEAIVRDIEAFANHYLAGMAWGMVDSTGWVELHGAGLDAVRRERTTRRGARSPSQRVRGAHTTIFSDLGQWALKVMLSHLWVRPKPGFVIDAGGMPVDRPIPNGLNLAARAHALQSSTAESPRARCAAITVRNPYSAALSDRRI